MTTARVRELTGRECAVLRALARGASMKEVARDLRVSINTVGTWTKRSYRKLGVASKRDAIRRHRRLPAHVCADPRTVPGPVTRNP